LSEDTKKPFWLALHRTNRVLPEVGINPGPAFEPTPTTEIGVVELISEQMR
jgi:hypothetical protein